MLNGFTSIFNLLNARLSRRIALWVFISIVVVEALILLPSAYRRERELIQHLEDVGVASISPLLRLCGSQITAPKIHQVAQQLMLESRVEGGHVYTEEGEAIAYFGEVPELNFNNVKNAPSVRFRSRDGNRYEMSMWTEAQGKPYLVIVRLDSSQISQEIKAFIIRIFGLVILICIFVTLATLAALAPAVIAPILKLRKALIAVGESPGAFTGDLDCLALAKNRRDELGEVLIDFNRMNHQINRYFKEIQESKKELENLVAEVESARDQSEKLLLNILPYTIAQQLKQGVYPIAESFPNATVLFADLVGFTQLSTEVPAVEVVELLNKIFSLFDQLAQQYAVEKIKTIGDAYMVVGGVPQPHPDCTQAIAQMALDMQREVRQLAAETGIPLTIRIGINNGPVVAGVIGIKKFIYDLWGDTVNTASRMESHGIPGQIQVSEVTYFLLRDRFQFESRGTINVKGKGMMKTYLLLGWKEEPTAELKLTASSSIGSVDAASGIHGP
ncbi:adenylate/guanylate cyclase domain-containing protein [Laspinema olomoucense]|uniref:adenylate/guanylate cyclase domain-containing protein n=1 Tax=Laspinema olomoucense TaxID=3231600 RepID=UPI0021BB99BE|nr:adenylate/guanylate cyclase domain-containing protein [Laspinema sp. D3a]MCT7987317.1 adenylate/guanylate cyclase domain-containing protein [Laspinema sp. D3a]